MQIRIEQPKDRTTIDLDRCRYPNKELVVASGDDPGLIALSVSRSADGWRLSAGLIPNVSAERRSIARAAGLNIYIYTRRVHTYMQTYQ